MANHMSVEAFLVKKEDTYGNEQVECPAPCGVLIYESRNTRTYWRDDEFWPRETQALHAPKTGPRKGLVLYIAMGLIRDQASCQYTANPDRATRRLTSQACRSRRDPPPYLRPRRGRRCQRNRKGNGRSCEPLETGALVSIITTT